MSFKLRAQAKACGLFFGALSLMLSLSGCDFFLSRQSPPAEEQVVFSSASVSCLRDVPSALSRFLKDDINDTQIAQNFLCLRSTLEHFQKFTKGQENPEQYTTEEVRSFLNEALAVDNRVSSAFMTEIMKLKTVLLGGTEHVLTKKEITQARALLEVFESEFQKLRGKMRILLFQAPRDGVALEDLKAAQKQLEQSVARLFEVAKAEPTFYSFDDIQNFVSELNIFLNDSQLLEQLLRWLPLTHKFKSLFLGEKTLAYSQKDWQQVLGWSVRGYGLTLQFVYWIKNLSLDKPDEMDRLIDFGDSIFDLIQDSPVLKETAELSLAAVDEVFIEILKTGLLKISIPLPVIQESLRMALTTLVDGPFPQRRSPHEVEFLTQQNLGRLRYEWNVWALTQKQLNRTFKDPGKVIYYPDFVSQITEQYGQELVKGRPGLKPGEARELYQTWLEWRALMTAPFPVLWDHQDRMILRRDHSHSQLGFVGMTKVTLLRTFTRMILRGYGSGEQKNLWNLKIKPADFNLFQYDFQVIGHDLHALDPRTPAPAARTFKEASFFTFSGDGDEVLTSVELFEELNILAGAGGMIATDLLSRGVAAGCKTEKNDVFGLPYLETLCFRRMFRFEFLDAFKSAPGLMALNMGMRRHVREEEFYQNLWDLAVAPHSVAGLTEYGDIRTYSTILYYVEILRLLYDTNEDMELSQEEIEAAAPRFRSFIAEKSPLGDNLVDSIFVCLVFEQRKPGADFSTAGCLVKAQFGYNPVGPAELLKVLAVLKADITATTGFNPQMVLPGSSKIRAPLK